MSSLQQPLSSHWADQVAFRLCKKNDKDSYTLASGITPSGVVHIGNFREVITVDLVARAVRSLGRKARFIYSWDDFDTFRKVPKNLPRQEELVKYLRLPISVVPDPYDKDESYAAHNEKVFEKELDQLGIHPEYIYQYKQYSSGKYATEIRKALEQKDKIASILNEWRSEPLGKDWLPTTMYCESCGKDEMDYERYDGEWSYSYKCKNCGHEATTDIRTTKNLKLNWRTDWPMRWAFEKVDFEPGGKDHSSQGGSFDTAKRIVSEVWNWKAPEYQQYDFVSIKGLTGKMSSSSGVLISLSEALDVYDPQMIRWIFVMQKPNRDFALAFDSDVIKNYDEFDAQEKLVFNDKSNSKWAFFKRAYELSLTTETTIDSMKPPVRAPFRELCNRLQICDMDIDKTYSKFYSSTITSESDIKNFHSRSARAIFWLEHYASEEFKYRLNSQKILDSQLGLSSNVTEAICNLKQMISSIDLSSIDTKDLNQKIYDCFNTICDSKEFFSAVYQKIIGRPQGPRLPSFLKEIGKERVVNLL